MTRINIFVLIFVSTLILSSCSPMFQRAYIATSPNVNCFERDNEKNLKLSLFLNHYELQSNFVINKFLGLSASINGGFRRQIGGELAGIYYKKFNDKNYFEIQSGYGYFNNKSKISDMPWNAGALIEYGQWFSRNTNTNYHKIFIQPTYFYNLKNVNLGFAVKISANYFDRYHYYSSMFDNAKGDYDNYYLRSTADFRYKWNFACEPVFRVQFKRKLFLQLSGIFTTNIEKTPIYYSHYLSGDLREQKITGSLYNPQHINFIFTIGYEIKFGKKKE